MTEASILLPASERPVVRLKAHADKRLLLGYPWVYSNEILMTAEVKDLPLGGLVTLARSDGKPLGIAIFNRLPLISARLLTRDVDADIDTAFFAARLRRALALRQALIPEPFYRLIHAEADGFPGLVIDRYGEVLVLQVNSAGMERLLPTLLEALEQVLAPATLLLRNDSGARQMEGLDNQVSLIKGSLDGPVEVPENGARYLADLREGQKTGWFFDQRDNRAWVARLAQGRRVLDSYCFTGGFALLAALAGASEVVAIDRSQSALDLAAQGAELNAVAARCHLIKAKAFTQMQTLYEAGERFDLVIVDPPAFIKSKKDLKQGSKGYRKLARLAANLVTPGGFLFTASCSHALSPALFAEQISRGLNDAGRSGRVLASAGAGPDHPVHPALPESAYLKTQAIALD